MELETAQVELDVLYEIARMRQGTRPCVAAPKPGIEDLRVLLADDNEINRIILRSLLLQLGTRADLAADGRKALEAVLAREYDVVLMDVEMPDMDGLEATREIRRLLPRNQQPMICALSAHREERMGEACREAGMDQYLPKPPALEQVRSVLRKQAAVLRRRAGAA